MENPAITILKNERRAIAIAVDALQTQLKAEKARLGAIDDAIIRLSGPSLSLEPSISAEIGDSPGLSASIEKALTDYPDGFEKPLLIETLRFYGVTSSENGIHSTLSRLKKRGRIFKVGDRWIHANNMKKSPELSPEDLF
jgi:hypothetical protein